MLSTDAFFDEQATRTLVHMQFGGADLGECLVTMQAIPPGDMAAWQREWRALADRIAAVGDACAATDHDVSAREAYLRASNYYRTSYVMQYGAPTAPALVEAFERESACFAEFAARAEPELEPLEIPYEGTTLQGWFCPAPRAHGRTRTLVATGGYDSTLHESYFAFAVAANRRGYHCLLFDGPGQGRALIEQGLPMRPDWEQVVRPVIDLALNRADVDPARIALAGWSLGGYLSLRAACGEPRLAACVADPGMTGLWAPIRDMFADLPAAALEDPLAADPALFEPYTRRIEASPGTRWKIVQRAFWVHDVTSLAGYVAAARGYDLRAMLSAVRCPVFLSQAERDPLATRAREVYDALPGPKVLVPFATSEGAGDHCSILARSLLHQRMFDWLDGVL